MIRREKMKRELESNRALVECASEFNLVGDLTRLKICYLLCRHRELPVGEIASLVGVSVSAVSHTLKKLKEANVVESRREFRTVYYRLAAAPIVRALKKRLKIDAQT